MQFPLTNVHIPLLYFLRNVFEDIVEVNVDKKLILKILDFTKIILIKQLLWGGE